MSLRGVAEVNTRGAALFFLFSCSCCRCISVVNNNKAPAPRPAALARGGEELTPPQLSVLARSFPVPRGRTATGGWGFICSSSRVDRIQPTYAERLRSLTGSQIKADQSRSRRPPTRTVPSPPQARIRRFGTFRYSSSLGIERTTPGSTFFQLHQFPVSTFL